MSTYTAAAIIPAYEAIAMEFGCTIQAASYLTSLQIAILGGAYNLVILDRVEPDRSYSYRRATLLQAIVEQIWSKTNLLDLFDRLWCV